MARVTKTFEFTLRITVESEVGGILRDEERQELVRLVRYLEGTKGVAPQSLDDFKRSIAEMSQRMTDTELARELGVHRLTIGEWRKRFGLPLKQVHPPKVLAAPPAGPA